MTPDQYAAATRELLEALADLGLRATDLLHTEPTPEPDPVVVSTAEGLQAALDTGGLVRIADGATLTGRFVIRRPAILRGGLGAALRGDRGPALAVPPGVSDVAVIGPLGLTADASDTVVRLGANDAALQGTLDAVPRRILLQDLTIPSHRGKRGIEVNAADVAIRGCTVHDVWAPGSGTLAGPDSQAIWIHNTPGPVTIGHCDLTAGSEVIMVGGDTMRLVGVIPSDITIHDSRLWRPMVWQTDGINRAVKTGLELKTGRRVRVTDCEILGNWKASQTGFAITLTPRAGGCVEDVLFERVTVRDAGAVLNLTGHDEAGKPPTPARTTGIVFRSCTTEATVTLGGRGIFALLTMGPDALTVDQTTFRGDGSSFILGGDSERIGAIRVMASRFSAGKYGIMGGGKANLLDWSSWLDACDVAGNVIAGASSEFRSRVPENTFIAREDL
jgi:hypothetical protein